MFLGQVKTRRIAIEFANLQEGSNSYQVPALGDQNGSRWCDRVPVPVDGMGASVIGLVSL
jgi:hypothetical protein